MATVQSHIGQFHMPFIKKLKEQGHEVHVACFDNSSIKPGLNYDGIDKFYNVPFSRKPFKLTNFKSYKILKNIIKEQNYNIVHCHTPVGGITARLSSRRFRRNGLKVIYTAHGFHFYKGAPKRNWLMFYPMEYICSYFTDLLITINNEDYNFALKHLKAKKINYVPGVGIDIKKFAETNCNKSLRAQINVPEDAFLVISVGELNQNKNYFVVMDAISKLKSNNIFYCICGVGPLNDSLLQYSNKLNIKDRFSLLGYRRDIASLFKISDLVIQPSYREGLPLTVMEAIASKTAIIASDIRGCRDLIEKDDLFKPNDSDKIAELIKKKIQNNNFNISKNFNNIQKCSLDNVNMQLYELYECL